MQALEKGGWKVTNDPLSLKVMGEDLYIDLAAERETANARIAIELIALEVKSFQQDSLMYALHEAVGQYRNYVLALKTTQQEHTLYLGIPETVYETFFQRPFVMEVVQANHIRLLVVDTAKNEIVKWIE